ncbi:MAG: presqualene diphosphate synthase HpnD [Rhodomicrobium sp.]|nr:presqualene diphosphate synthase HpnD [Rhodomicrobium sp.]
MTSQAIEIEESTTTAAGRAYGSSFYAAMRIMPQGQREAMFEIYSFCRAVDDIADDQGPAELRLQKLEQWRQDIGAIYHGEPRAGLAGLAAAARNFQLERQDFWAIIDGMEMDVRQAIQAPEFVDLDLYCDRVASAVGRLSVRVFRLPAEEGRQLAEHLGRALQLTNILRDLDEDAAIGRLYLPREFLAEAGITSTDPSTVLAHPALPEVCGRIVSLARWRFSEADKIMNAHPRRMVRTPRVMAEAYKGILKALVARGWTAPRTPVRLSRPRLALVLLRHFIF